MIGLAFRRRVDTTGGWDRIRREGDWRGHTRWTHLHAECKGRKYETELLTRFHKQSAVYA